MQYRVGFLKLYLKCLIGEVSKDLTDSKKNKFQSLILTFQDKRLGRTDLVSHKIHTGNVKPVKLPPRRVPISHKEVVEKEIVDYLKLTL